MKILIRDGGTKGWKLAESIKAKAEAELQDLLVESPSLIPIDEIREGASQLVFAVKEFGLPGSGNTDVLAFSPGGDVAIIECKLATNPESKRKVIGQILEYAAYLWGTTYEEVNARIQRSKGKNLSELVEEFVEEEWNEEGFRKGVEHSLKSGSFILIIVVDEINEELRRIIRYVNECSSTAFSLHALELKKFRAEGIEILVPHLYGVSTTPTAGTGRKKWTEEEFFKVLNETVETEVVNVIKDLYEWARKTADKVSFGTGTETGSFIFYSLKGSKFISVFAVFTNGKLQLSYGWLVDQVGRETVQEFHRRLQEIPSFNQIPAEFEHKWPNIAIIDAFKVQENLEKFKQAVLWLHKKISA